MATFLNQNTGVNYNIPDIGEVFKHSADPSILIKRTGDSSFIGMEKSGIDTSSFKSYNPLDIGSALNLRSGTTSLPINWIQDASQFQQGPITPGANINIPIDVGPGSAAATGLPLVNPNFQQQMFGTGPLQPKEVSILSSSGGRETDTQNKVKLAEIENLLRTGDILGETVKKERGLRQQSAKEKLFLS